MSLSNHKPSRSSLNKGDATALEKRGSIPFIQTGSNRDARGERIEFLTVGEPTCLDVQVAGAPAPLLSQAILAGR